MSFEDRVMSQPDPDPESASNSLLTSTRCCFYFPYFSSRPRSSSAVWWQRISSSESQSRHHHRDRWWTRAFLKIREWSELVAGPRWKTFIRRFNKNRGGGGGCCGGGDHRHAGQGQFQYDPLSYALNFDEGPGQEVTLFDEDREFRSFSTRYAAAPPWNKKTINSISGGGGGLGPSSLDSRGKDGTSLA